MCCSALLGFTVTPSVCSQAAARMKALSCGLSCWGFGRTLAGTSSIMLSVRRAARRNTVIIGQGSEKQDLQHSAKGSTAHNQKAIQERERNRDIRIQGYVFASDIKISTGVCHGDVPFIESNNRNRDTRIQGYVFASDIKISTGVCLGDVPFIESNNRNTDTKIQGYIFASDIKISIGVCLGDVPFIESINKKTNITINHV